MNGVLGHDSEGYTEQEATWANWMNFVINMPLVQDRLLDLLTSSPARYQCITDAPWRS